jgi:hypothetical protein
MLFDADRDAGKPHVLTTRSGRVPDEPRKLLADTAAELQDLWAAEETSAFLISKRVCCALRGLIGASPAAAAALAGGGAPPQNVEAELLLDHAA